MPDPIQLTSVNALKLSDFQDQQTGTLQNGSIKLGKSTYSVKFTDGKVSVSRNFHLFNLFRTNAQNELRDAFKAQMYNTNGKNEALYTNTFKALEKNFKGGKVENLMLFGVDETNKSNKQGLEALDKFKEIHKPSQTDSDIPLYAKEFIDANRHKSASKPLQSTNFEKLIGIAGLSKYNMKQDFLGSLTRLSDFGSIANRLNQIPDSDVDPKLKADWLGFLQQNADRVNILSMLKQAIVDSKPGKLPTKDLTGWAAMMDKHGVARTLTSFLQKNMKGGLEVTPEIVECFRGLIESFDDPIFQDSVDLFKKRLAITARLNDNQKEIVMDCLINAVQREVMKLGLEFCREKKIPVLFQWTDGEGKTITPKELKNQYWSPDHKNDPHPKFSPILQTAMRHVQRMQNEPGSKLKFVQVNGAAPD